MLCTNQSIVDRRRALITIVQEEYGKLEIDVNFVGEGTFTFQIHSIPSMIDSSLSPGHGKERTGIHCFLLSHKRPEFGHLEIFVLFPCNKQDTIWILDP